MGLRNVLCRISVFVAGAASAGLVIASVHQLVTRSGRVLPYEGMKALSAAWAAPPEDDAADWLVSAGVEPPPPAARPEDLRAWLEQHYPVLTLELEDRDVLRAGSRLTLGGGPPRTLYVEPGIGLVMRVPRE